jgi:poly [ADP-ribose] polymerase
MAIIIKTETYVKSDPIKNNNKFWTFELYDDNSVITRWGRVGDPGDQKPYQFGSAAEAEKFCNSKVHEKTRNGRNGEIAYRKADVIGKPGETSVRTSSRSTIPDGQLQQTALKQITSDNKETEDLIKWLVKTNIHNITQATTMTYNVDTGLFSTPIGVVSKATVDEANQLLVKISDGVVANQWDDKAFGRMVGDYLMLIPANIGRKFNVRNIFPDLNAIQQQKAILDSLEVSIDQVVNGKKDDAAKDQPKEATVFSVKLTLIDDRVEMDRITKKFLSTLHRGHDCSHLRPKRAWMVEIETMRKAFDQRGKPVGNINEYYHGSKVCNVLSILSKGMLIVPSTSSNVCGRNYGDGLYFSSESTKSLNYSFGYWSGTRDNNCFLFMADVAMGNYYVPQHSDSKLRLPTGFHSCWAQAGKSGVQNHEQIVYNTYQTNPTRLIEFE